MGTQKWTFLSKCKSVYVNQGAWVSICRELWITLSGFLCFVFFCLYLTRKIHTCAIFLSVKIKILVVVNNKKRSWIGKRARTGIWEGLKGGKEREMIKLYYDLKNQKKYFYNSLYLLFLFFFYWKWIFFTYNILWLWFSLSPNPPDVRGGGEYLKKYFWKYTVGKFNREEVNEC